MRVPVDSNLVLSNLLSPNAATSSTGIILQAAIAGRFTLLMVQGVIDEVWQKLTEQPDLARIPRVDAEELLARLSAAAELVPLLPPPYPEIGRDRKDDFLIAHAIAATADFLITWDKDLLVLAQVDGVTIVSPPAFLRVLRETGRLMEGEPASPEDSARGGGQ